MQVAHENCVHCRCNRVPDDIGVHGHARHHWRRASTVQDYAADHVADDIVLDVDVDHAALAKADDAGRGAGDAVAGDVDIGHSAIAHRKLDRPRRGGTCRRGVGRRDKAHVDGVARNYGILHPVEVDAAPASGGRKIVVKDVVRHGQAGDVEQHHAGQGVAVDGIDLVARDHPVVAANAAAAAKAKADRAVGGVGNDIVDDGQIVVGVGAGFAADRRGTAVEAEAVNGDAVRCHGEIANHAAFAPARSVACHTGVGAEQRHRLVDRDIFRIAARRDQDGIACRCRVDCRLDGGITTVADKQEGSACVGDLLHAGDQVRAFAGCGHLPSGLLACDERIGIGHQRDAARRKHVRIAGGIGAVAACDDIIASAAVEAVVVGGACKHVGITGAGDVLAGTVGIDADLGCGAGEAVTGCNCRADILAGIGDAHADLFQHIFDEQVAAYANPVGIVDRHADIVADKGVAADAAAGVAKVVGIDTRRPAGEQVTRHRQVLFLPRRGHQTARGVAINRASAFEHHVLHSRAASSHINAGQLAGNRRAIQHLEAIQRRCSTKIEGRDHRLGAARRIGHAVDMARHSGVGAQDGDGLVNRNCLGINARTYQDALP